MSNNNDNNNSSEKLSIVELVSLTIIVFAIIIPTLLNLSNTNRLENEELYSWLTILSGIISLIWGLNSAKKPVKVTMLLAFFVAVLIHFFKFVN